MIEMDRLIIGTGKSYNRSKTCYSAVHRKQLLQNGQQHWTRVKPWVIESSLDVHSDHESLVTYAGVSFTQFFLAEADVLFLVAGSQRLNQVT